MFHFNAYAGLFNQCLPDSSERSRQRREVEKWIPHPHFQPPRDPQGRGGVTAQNHPYVLSIVLSENDIGVVFVKDAFTGGPWSVPVSAFTQEAYSNSYIHVLRLKEIHFVGLGDTSDNQGKTYLCLKTTATSYCMRRSSSFQQ